MGTKADFYVGRGTTAEWLGSVAYDGYPFGFDAKFFAPGKTAEEWRAAVLREVTGRKDGTLPEQGWPWPWGDSRTTDYAYAWDDGVIWCSCFGTAWYRYGIDNEPDGEQKVAVFPDMTKVQSVTYGPRSGILLFGSE